MTWSEKIRAFFKAKELNNREVCRTMDNYNETLYSRQLSSDEPNGTLILSIAKFFPDADINYFLRSDDQLGMVAEKGAKYKTRNIDLIGEIESRLKELKENLSTIS